MKNFVIGTIILIAIVTIYRLSSEDDVSSTRGGSYDYAPTKTFRGDICTDDCSGHEAGYAWAAKKDITDPDDCGGNSNSFIEGCMAWAEEN